MDYQQIDYELLRENKSLMIALKDSGDELARLRVEIRYLEANNIELIIKLEDSSVEISRLKIKLEDKEKNIGTIDAVLNSRNPAA